jgi:hypothetical protein
MYRFVPHLSIYKQIHPTYSGNTHSEIPFEDLPHSLYPPYTYRFIPHILIIRTDSFHVFGECAQIISNLWNGIIFFTAFNGVLFKNKTMYECNWTKDPQGIIDNLALAGKKIYFRELSEYAE